MFFSFINVGLWLSPVQWEVFLKAVDVFHLKYLRENIIIMKHLTVFLFLSICKPTCCFNRGSRNRRWWTPIIPWMLDLEGFTDPWGGYHLTKMWGAFSESKPLDRIRVQERMALGVLWDWGEAGSKEHPQVRPGVTLREAVRRLITLAPGFGTEHSWMRTFLHGRIPVHIRCLGTACLTTRCIPSCCSNCWPSLENYQGVTRWGWCSLHRHPEAGLQPVTNQLGWRVPLPPGRQGCVTVVQSPPLDGSSSGWPLSMVTSSLASSLSSFPPLPCSLCFPDNTVLVIARLPRSAHQEPILSMLCVHVWLPADSTGQGKEDCRQLNGLFMSFHALLSPASRKCPLILTANQVTLPILNCI